MYDEQTDDLRPVAVGETRVRRGPTAPRSSGLSAVLPPPRPAFRRDVSQIIRSRPVFIGVRRPRHRVRRAIGATALCVAVMSLEFWALSQIPEAKPAPAHPAPAVASQKPATPPQPAARVPAMMMTVGTQEMAQALAVSDTAIPTNTSGAERHASRARREAARERPALPQQPVRPRVQAVANAPKVASRPAEMPAADSASQPAPFTGGLVVDSLPAGARVFVDRQLVGFTPLALPNVTIGTRVVRLEADAHEAWSSAVRVVADEQTHLNVQLNRASNR